MTRPLCREVQDFYGRRYRVGPSDRDLLGHSRSWMPWAAGLAMLAASAGQYGYAAMLPVLAEAHGWSVVQAFWILAIWAACQASAVYPVIWLRDRLRLAPAATMCVGAVLCATGLVSLGGAGSYAVIVLNHAVLGGIGAGMIYGTGIGVVAMWYPERPARTYFVSGAFAYGAVPFVVLAAQVAVPADVETLLAIAGVLVFVIVGAAALVLRDPPERWWPVHLDPRRWALDKSVNPGLRHNRPAVRRYSPGEVLKCPASGLLYGTVILSAAVALFDIVYIGMFAMTNGWGIGFAAAAVGVLAGASGIARAAASWAGDRFGRARVIRFALYGGAAAQLLLLAAGQNQLALMLVAGCCLAGASAGTGYALLPGLVDDHFGDRQGLPNFGLFYGAKAAGGVLGVGVAAFFAGPQGHSAGFIAAAVLSLTGAVLIRMLRRPGRPRLVLPGAVPRVLAG